MNTQIFDRMLKKIIENKLINSKFHEIILQLKELDNNYLDDFINRKKIIETIRQYITFIRSKTHVFNSELEELESFYAYRDYYVDDYLKVMQLILMLANQNGNDYKLIEVYASDTVKLNGETKNLYGRTWIILPKKVCQFFDRKIYSHNEISEICTSIIKMGYSIVITTYHYFDGNVKPKVERDINHLEIPHGGMIGNLSFYFHDDNLLKAVIMLNNKIEEWGPDFYNIDVETLYNLIKANMNNKTKRKINIQGGVYNV